MAYYTGVGSRETPDSILALMQETGHRLSKLGWTLRSGAADGADRAFEFGCDIAHGDKQIFIPWEGFSGRSRAEDGVLVPTGALASIASEIASQTHPAWERLSKGAKALHTRNCYQVLGQDLATPSKFVLCYATLDKHGEPKGGTRTAIKIAERHGVEVFNLYLEENVQRVRAWLNIES